MGMDDPEYRLKTRYMRRLKAVVLAYFAGLSRRVVEAVDESAIA